MKLDIRGKGGFVITDAIYNYLEKKLKKIDKVFQHEIEAYVVCKVYREGTKVEITIPIKFITMRAEVQDRDLYAGIDRAVDKLEAQIRKNKHRMNRSLQERVGLRNAFQNDYLNLEELEKELTSPVKKKKMKLEILTLEEAITQIELIGHDFFVFKNEDKVTSLLYKRDDGKYGLIETE